MTLIIATGASQNHFKTVVQFLRSVDVAKCTCYFYDLGLNQESLEYINNTFKVVIRKFDYTTYPDYYNININAGEYAWKPALMAEVLHELEMSGADLSDTVLMWLDAGTKVVSDLSAVHAHTRKHLIYTPVSSSAISHWTHIGTQRWFSIENDTAMLKKQNRAGGVLSYYIGDQRVRDFIKKFADCAKIRECIAPIGANRNNHRQDQAVLSIMYYKFIEEYSIPECERNLLCVSIHNDID